MNSVLSYIAGLLVLVLFGALIGPSVVDWNGFRAGIETQISDATGRHVTIEGDISFVILPSPRFRLDTIAIRPSAEAEPFARADVLEGEVALTPLLRGEIEVSRIRARDFSIDLKRDADGRMNWVSENGDAAIGAVNPADVRLDLVSFENGFLRFDDEPSGRVFEFSSLNGELKAGSLLGPYRFDGTFILDDEALLLGWGVGLISGDRAFPVSVDVKSERFKWRASFSGIGTEASLAGRLDGVIQMQIGEARTVNEVVEPSFLTAKAGLVVGRRQATFRDLEVMVAGAPLKGQAVLKYDGAPVLNGRLGGALLPLDTVLQSFQRLDFPRTRSVLPAGLSGSFDIAVAEATHSFGEQGLRVRDVAMDLGFADGVLSVDALRGELPGLAEASLSGVLKMENRVPRFDGSVFGSISNLAGFEKWLAERGRGTGAVTGSYTPTAKGTLNFTTSLALKRSLVQAYGFSAVFEDGTDEHAPLTGGFSWARQKDVSAASLELKGGFADLSFLSGLESWVQEAAQWDLTGLNGQLVLDIDALKYQRLAYANVDVVANVKDGVLGIERASANYASSHRSVSGLEGDGDAEAQTTAALSLTGSVTSILPRFAGDLSGALNAALAVELANGYLDFALRGVDEGRVSFQLRGAAVDANNGEGGHEVRLDAQGEINAAAITFRAAERFSGDDSPRTELSMTISDPASRLLPVLFDLPEGTEVPQGELLLTLLGAREGSMETAFLYRAEGASLSLKGNLKDAFGDAQFSGRFEAKADEYARLAAQFALNGPLSDLVAQNGHRGAVLATGELEWRATDLSVRDVEAVAGSFRVSGEGQADWSGELVTLNADLQLGRLSLDHLFEADGSGGWSAQPLDWSALGQAAGSFEVEVSALDVAGLSFSDIATTASLQDGVLSLSPMTGQFGDGRVTMGLRVEGGEGVPGIGLTLAVEDTELDAATKMIFGEPLAAGTVTGNLQIEGRGRSQLGLVSTLAGRGRLALRSGSFAGFDLSAFHKGIDGLQDVSQFAALVDLTLFKGANGFDLMEGTISVEDGVLKYVAESGEVAGASSTRVTGFADLVRRELDLETRFSLVGDNPLPPMTMVLGGPLRDLSRKLDVINLQAAVAQRMLIGELKASGVENVPQELLELIVSPDREDGLDVPIDEALPGDEDGGATVPALAPELETKKDEVPFPVEPANAPEAEDQTADAGTDEAATNAANNTAVNVGNDDVPLPRLKPQRGQRR